MRHRRSAFPHRFTVIENFKLDRWQAKKHYFGVPEATLMAQQAYADSAHTSSNMRIVKCQTMCFLSIILVTALRSSSCAPSCKEYMEQGKVSLFAPSLPARVPSLLAVLEARGHCDPCPRSLDVSHRAPRQASQGKAPSAPHLLSLTTVGSASTATMVPFATGSSTPSKNAIGS